MSTPHVIASSSSHALSASNIVGRYYRVGKKIGEGSYGVVFEGSNLLNSAQVAIKLEYRKSDAPQLRDEYRSYRVLWGTPGVPQAYHFSQAGLHNVLVIDLLGPSLEDLFDMCGRKFSIKTVCMAAKQMLTRVQAVHDKSLIHCDIEPDNFLIGIPGTKNAKMIHIIDFGMANYYRYPKTKTHNPYHDRKLLLGITRYTSINAHFGRERSRRDDLESLGYVFMYFLQGGLPWQGLRAANNKEKYEKMGEKKQSTPISELCEGFPVEFSIYMNYVRKLGFEENPDYDFLRELFTKVMKTIGEPEDDVYDWMLLNGGKGWEASTKPHVHSSATPACELQGPSTSTPAPAHVSKSRSWEASTIAGHLKSMTDLLINRAAELTNQPDFHGIDHFTPEFGNPQAIELDIEGWEQTLLPFLNVLDKLLVPSKIDTLMDRYCQQCRFFQITYDILTHLKSLRGREEPDVEKYLKSLEEIIRYGDFELNFGCVLFGSAAIVGSLMAVLAHQRQ